MVGWTSLAHVFLPTTTIFHTIAWPDRLSVERKKKNERTRETRGKDRTAILSVSPCFLSPFTVWLALQKSASYFEVVGWAFHWPEWTEATDGDKSHHQTFVTMHQLSQKMIRWGKGRRRLARSFSLVRDKGHPASFLFPRTTRELKSKVTFSQGRELNSYILKVLITPMFHVFCSLLEGIMYECSNGDTKPVKKYCVIPVGKRSILLSLGLTLCLFSSMSNIFWMKIKMSFFYRCHNFGCIVTLGQRKKGQSNWFELMIISCSGQLSPPLPHLCSLSPKSCQSHKELHFAWVHFQLGSV